MPIVDHFDKDTRSEYLDIGPEFLGVPSRDDVELRSEEELMIRLDRISSPRERLKEFLKSQVQFSRVPTHEATMIRSVGLAGLFVGWILGGLTRSQGLHEEFIRKHNAAVFEGVHRSKRKYVDTLIYTVLRRGTKFGVGCGLLCTSAGLISFGSIAYRAKIHYPDWLVGFSTLGAITRCWLGMRGVVAGAGFGLIGGCFALGLAKGMELLSGKSVTQIRYLKHMEYVKGREDYLNRLHRVRDKEDRARIAAIS